MSTPSHTSRSGSGLTSVIAVLGFLLIAVVGAVLVLKIRKRMRMQASDENVMSQTEAADEAKENERYTVAKDLYEKTLEAALVHREAYDDERMQDHIEHIRQTLKLDEIRLGGQGHVLFEGKWVSPDDKKRIEEERHAASMRAKGLVLHEGKWVTCEERRRALGLVKFRGGWVRPEMRERILAVERTAQDRAKEDEFRLTAKMPLHVDPARKAFLVDDFESGNVWSVQEWADDAGLEIIERATSKELNMYYVPSDKQKFAVGRPLICDISSRDKCLVDVCNATENTVEMALALIGRTYSESPSTRVSPGEHKDVGFDLKASHFKCAASKWKHKAKLTDANAIKQMVLVFMLSHEGELYVDNVRLVRTD